MENTSENIDGNNTKSIKKAKGINSIIWAVAGFIILFALGIGDFYFGLLATEIDLSVFLISLSMAVLGSLFFFWLGRLYNAGKKIAVYFSLFLIITSIALPIIQGPAEGDMDMLIGLVTYYGPGQLIKELFGSLPFNSLPFNILIGSMFVNFSWITWGIIGLLVGQIIDLINKRLRKR